MASIKETVSNIRNYFSSSQEMLDGKAWPGGGSGILDNFFGRDVFNEEEMTVHNEMYRVREMIDNNAFVASALSTYQSIFIGDELMIESSDERTQEWFNEEWLPESGLKEAIGNGGAGEHYKGIGNAYYHVKRGQATGMPKEFELIAKPENMWIRKDDDGNVRDYILEIDRGVQGDEKDNTQAQYYNLGYGGYEREAVYGVQYDKDEIVHVAQGMHQIPPYGRSDLASASSDEKILREIERSYGVIARHKQVPKYIFSFFDTHDGDRMPMNQEEFEEKVQELNNLSDKDNPIWNGVDVEKTDYSYGGKEIKMQETIDYLKRKITAPVAPQAILHGDMSTNAISNDQMAAWFQEIRGDRHAHIDAFKPILREVAEKAPKSGLSSDVSISFGQLRLSTEQSREQEVVDRWQKGLITLDEARQELGYPEDEQFEDDPYKWEVSNQPSGGAQAVQQSLRQVIDDE